MPPRKKPVTNVAGLEQTLKAYGDRLGAEHAALIALARSLAVSVDADPENAALWREYRAALSALMTVGAGDGIDDDTRDFLLTIRTPR